MTSCLFLTLRLTLGVSVENLHSFDQESSEELTISSESDSQVVSVTHLLGVSVDHDRRRTSLHIKPVSGSHVVSAGGVRSSPGVGVHLGEVEEQWYQHLSDHD